MSTELLIALVRGSLLLFSTIILPGVLLERLLVRSRHLCEVAFLAPILGTVATGSVAINHWVRVRSLLYRHSGARL